MSTLSVQTITDIRSIDFSNTNFATAYATANSAYNQDNVVFGVANASYGFSNSAYASINSNWTVTNTVYGVANSTYAASNSNWTVTNTVYGVANAAFASANNVGPQIAPAFNTANAAYNAANNVNLSAPYNTANAAFGKANTALQNTSGTFVGYLKHTDYVLAGGITSINPDNVGAGAGVGSVTDSTTGFSAPGIVFGSGSGQMGAVVYGSNTMYFGTNSGSPSTLNTRMTLTKDSILYVNGSVQAPIFYDKDNTSYYLDPASTSNLNAVNVSGVSNSSSGYCKLVNGFIMQWGNFSIGDGGTQNVTFPIAFSTACYAVNVTQIYQNGADQYQNGVRCTGFPSTTGVSIRQNTNGTNSFFWVAIGF